MRVGTNNPGFSLIELMIATGIAILIVVGFAGLMANILKSANRFGDKASTMLDASVSARYVVDKIRNVPKFNPPENLSTGSALLYDGITNVPANLAPQDCQTSAGFSVLRLTSVAKKDNPETLLRAYDSTKATTGDTSTAAELRFTFTSGTSAFGNTPTPSEVLLIDVDGYEIRRYKVYSSNTRTTNLDPYSDLPATDPSGNPMSFTYTFAFLRDPKSADGGSVNGLVWSFVTGSIMYPTSTSVICVSRSQGTLVEIDENSGSVTTLVRPPNQKYHVSLFTVEFGNTKKNDRLENAPFTTDYVNSTQRQCMNVVRMRLQMAENDIQGPPSLNFEKYVLLPNYNSQISVTCP